jgi:SAM-dependent methyltransferase
VASNWDLRYASGECGEKPPDPVVIEAARITGPGRALDLACGLGRHTRYLAERGWRVTAVDSSAVALRVLREQALPNVEVVQADLEQHEYQIAREGFDLILDCLYLQRSLFPAIRAGVRRDGLFAGVFATAGMNPAFLVAPGEIRSVFEDWELLLYTESEQRTSIIARRP